MNIKQKILDKVKHESFYAMTKEELQKRQKRMWENSWIFTLNSIVFLSVSMWFFYIGLQHTAIILVICAVGIIMIAMFLDMALNQIDTVLFLMEHERRFE